MSTSTTAYRNIQSSRSFIRRHIRTSATNPALPTTATDRTRISSQTNNVRPPLSRMRASFSTNSIASTDMSSPVSASPSLQSQSVVSSNSSNESSSSKPSKQTYTFSNPPRELQRQSIQNMKHLRNSQLRQRVSSAPDENSFQNSPRSVINQQKPSSANGSSTPRSREDNHNQPLSTHHFLKRDEQQKSSLNALMKEQERSRVPKAVQKRRIILLFRRVPPASSPLVSPRQTKNISPVKQDIIANDHINQQHNKSHHDEMQQFTNNITSDSSQNDAFLGFDQAEIADSKQIAAILADIQSSDEWVSGSITSGTSRRHSQKSFDPTKYEYVAKNSFDTTTFKLSPRTLKPDEDQAARSRFSINYRNEMLSSANAQIPPLMASIVTENNNTIGTGSGSDKTFTFRLNATATMKKQGSMEDVEPTPSTIDGEQVQLCFDEILKCFYDPSTGTYYELTSA